MTGRPRLIIAGLLTVLLSSVACAPTGSGGGPFPPRPGDLRVSGLAACDVVDQTQRRGLGVFSANLDPARANTCIFLADKGDNYYAQVYPQTSAASLVPGAPNYQGAALRFVDPRVVTVDGYGAVQATQTFNYSDYNCLLGIDVGPDASIIVGYEKTSAQARSRTVGSREEGCARASRFASMVLATVRARQTP